jgi:hypothetical protein
VVVSRRSLGERLDQPSILLASASRQPPVEELRSNRRET